MEVRAKWHPDNGFSSTRWVLIDLGCIDSSRIGPDPLYLLEVDGSRDCKASEASVSRTTYDKTKIASFRKNYHFLPNFIESNILVSRQEETCYDVVEARTRNIEDDALGERVRQPISLALRILL